MRLFLRKLHYSRPQKKQRVVSEETKAKISVSNKGKTRTAEQKRASSERLKGKVPEAANEGAKKWHKKNGGSYWKGKKMSDEAKAYMKAAQQKRAMIGPLSNLFRGIQTIFFNIRQ